MLQRNVWGVLVLALAASVAMGLAGSLEAAAPQAGAKKIQVLLVTGVDMHNWRETAPLLAEHLRKDSRLEVRVVEDPHLLGSTSLDPYDVILLHFMNWKVPAPGEAARQNLKKAVESGKGLVLVHFACGAWQDWPEFVNVAGRVWDPKLRGHDPRGPFRVEIAKPDHPITKGLAPFETDDELYTCLRGEGPIEVLATARSKVDGKDYPMAFTYASGQGRVFHCVLGHDAKAFGESVGELFRRGTAWSAQQSPTP